MYVRLRVIVQGDIVQNIAMDTEHLHFNRQLLQPFLLVSTSYIHGQDLLHPSPIDKESEGSPATLAGDNFRWDTCCEELARTSNMETMAADSREASSLPDRGAKGEKEGFCRHRVTRGGGKGEERSGAGDVRVHGEVKGEGLKGAQMIITCSQNNCGAFFLGRLGPRNTEGGAARSIPVGAVDDLY